MNKQRTDAEVDMLFERSLWPEVCWDDTPLGQYQTEERVRTREQQVDGLLDLVDRIVEERGVEFWELEALLSECSTLSFTRDHVETIVDSGQAEEFKERLLAEYPKE